MLTKEHFESYAGKEAFKEVVQSNSTKKNFESLMETLDYESCLSAMTNPIFLSLGNCKGEFTTTFTLSI